MAHSPLIEGIYQNVRLPITEVILKTAVIDLAAREDILLIQAAGNADEDACGWGFGDESQYTPGTAEYKATAKVELTSRRRRLEAFAGALLLACAVTSAVHSQATGYLVDEENLFARDLVSLDSMLIGPTGSITSGGLAMRSDGVLFSASYFTDELWQIDPESGAGTLVGPLGFDVTTDAGLTFDACGDLWIASGRGTLYQVDPETAATTLVADFDDNWIIALTARGERLLALVQVGFPRQLAWIDPEKGTLVTFGDLINIPTLQGGLDFDESGGLWALLWANDPIPVPWVSSIFSLNPTTGQILGVSEDFGPPLAGNLALSPPRGFCGGSPVAVPASSTLSRITLVLLLAAAGSLVMLTSK